MYSIPFGNENFASETKFLKSTFGQLSDTNSPLCVDITAVTTALHFTYIIRFHGNRLLRSTGIKRSDKGGIYYV